MYKFSMAILVSLFAITAMGAEACGPSALSMLLQAPENTVFVGNPGRLKEVLLQRLAQPLDYIQEECAPDSCSVILSASEGTQTSSIFSFQVKDGKINGEVNLLSAN